MKKNRLVCMMAFVLLLSACGASQSGDGTGTKGAAGGQEAGTEKAKAEAVKLTAEQAHERMESGDPLVILDVRTAEEYAEAHIPGAVLLPNEEIGTERPGELPDLEAEILVYCRSGNRSAKAAKKLVELGYTKVYDFGGINSWTYETEAGKRD